MALEIQDGDVWRSESNGLEFKILNILPAYPVYVVMFPDDRIRYCRHDELEEIFSDCKLVVGKDGGVSMDEYDRRERVR